MTNKLIELRTKMDARFRTVARPDKLWAEITQAIVSQFNAQLPRQSTKDKWKNLRSSYRLINQNKHPSHYTKDSWPFYHLLEQYNRVKQELDSKAPHSTPQLSLDANKMGGIGGGGGMHSQQQHSDDEDGDGHDGEDDDDEDDDEDNDGGGGMDGGGKGKDKSGSKKRARSSTSSGAHAAVAAAAQAAAAAAYGSSSLSSHSSLSGPHAVAALGSVNPDLLNLLRPKDVSRKERGKEAEDRRCPFDCWPGE